MKSVDRIKTSPISHSLDLEKAVEHVLWVSRWQSSGHFLLAAMRDAHRSFVERHWICNRDPGLSVKVRRFLRLHADDGLTILYGVNSFSKPEAKAAYANTSRLAFVDADRSVLPGPGPSPSRIVESSPVTTICFGSYRGRCLPRTCRASTGRLRTSSAAIEAGTHRPSCFACRGLSIKADL